MFWPRQTYQKGNFDVTVVLTDSHGGSTNATFGITVYQPPRFDGSVSKQIELMVSNQANYSLPVMQGMSDEYVVHEVSLPKFAAFNFPNYTF